MKICLGLIFLITTTFSFGLSIESEKYIKQGEESFLNDEFDKSLHFFRLATSNSYKLQNELSETYLIIGQFYATNGIYDLALEYYFNALDESIRTSDELRTQEVYNSIGGAYYDRMHYLEAKKYWNKSKKINNSLSNAKGLSSNLNNLGEIEYLDGNYEKAMDLFNKSSRLKEGVKDSLGLGTVLLNLANTSFYTNQLDSGIVHLERSRGIAEKLNSVWLKQYVSRTYGIYYQELGNLQLSNTWYHRSLNLLEVRANADHSLKKSIYDGLSQNHKMLGELDSSMIYQSMLNGLEIDHIEKEKQIIKTAAKVNSSIVKKDNEIKSLKESSRFRRNMYFIIIIVLILIILFGIIINLQRNKVITQKNLTIQKEKDLLAMKSRFMSTASHQFRTPLAVIQSSIGLIAMQRDKMDDELQKSFDKSYKRIRDYIELMTTLMDQVLTTETIANNSVDFVKSPVNISGLCMDIVNSHNEIQDDGREIEFISGSEAVVLQLNERVMIHALSNLVSNAFKYSVDSPSPKLTIEYQKNLVTISILDHGIGIPKEDQDHLFEPFFRGSNAIDYLGTGLGLAITNEYVLAMGGTIEVKSELNNGAEFIINLPK